MSKVPSLRATLLLPGAAGVLAAALFAYWSWPGPGKSVSLRAPGTDRIAGQGGGVANPVLAGKLLRAAADVPVPNLRGTWPQFRGPNRDGISPETQALLHAWGPGGPGELWSMDVGEGFGGPAILHGRVYLMDYDAVRKQDALRCVSLADGREIWRYAYPVSIKRNHGMTRTVPAVSDRVVVGMGPKCDVVCLDPATGELRWGLDLVRQYGTTIPPWYTGQCPLIDSNSIILAPAGKDALLLAVDALSGRPLWQTPNPQGWKMTHSSVVPMDFAGQRMYLYCASSGVVGVSADTGAQLWATGDWKITFATVPSPVPLEGGRVFLSGGYKAGSLMLRLKKQGDHFAVETVFRLEESVFGATQQTPILYQNHLYGIRPDGRFVCLDLDGKPVWTSQAGQPFGLGSFLLADGVFFALNDTGLLRLIEATPEKYMLLGQAQVLKGRESWGPLALAGGRLLARDLNRMVCLDVARH